MSRRPITGIIAGRPDRMHPKLTPAQRKRQMEIARAQRASFPRRGRIPTDKYYQDIINAARDRGSYRRPTYGETYGQRIVDRLNGNRSSGSGNFGFRRAPGARYQRQAPVRGKLTGPDMQRAREAGMTPDEWLASRGRGRGSQTTSGFWAGDKSRGIPGEWDHLKGDGRSRSRRRRRGGRMREDGPGRYGRRRPTGRDRVIDGGWDRGGRVLDDPAPSRRRRKRKDSKKKKRRRSSKTIPVSRRRVEQVFNRYAPRAPRDNSRYRRDFYGQNRSDVDYSRFRRDFFGHNLRRKPRRFDFRRRIGPSNYQR